MNRNTKVFDVVKFFNEEIGTYTVHLSGKYGRNFTFKAEKKEETLVSADPSLLKTVVTRILSKAFRHTNPGSAVAVTVSTTGESLTVNVHNEGKGISRVFMNSRSERTLYKISRSIILRITGGGTETLPFSP